MSEALTRCEQELLRDAVRDVLGLHFDDARLGELATTMRGRLAATGTEVQSYVHLLRGPNGRAERSTLAALLTVCETYFFRSAGQLRALSEVVIPDRLRARRASRRLRVLSAGCSSGEEPYSVAILLRESFPELETWDVRITGIDLNPAMLARARAGRFSEWSLRDTPDPVRRRWFRPSGSELVLDPRILRAVTLEERNLLEDAPAFWQEASFDVVFFRNVGMYFPPDAMRAVTARIARALAPGGFLFLGHAETLRGISQDFHLRHSHECFYYQRRGAGDEEARAPGPDVARAEPAPGVAASWVDAIQRASERIAALGLRPAEPPRPDGGRADAGASSPPGPRQLAQAVELMREERHSEALDLLAELPGGTGVDPDAELLRAVLLTSRGQMEQAERTCDDLLRLDELNAGAHYLAALCREHRGDRQGAAEHDQAAAYVDPSFAMPRLHLGLLARRAGDRAAACRELGQAEVLLQREDPSRILLFGGGFAREGLLQLCRAELRACGGAA